MHLVVFQRVFSEGRAKWTARLRREGFRCESAVQHANPVILLGRIQLSSQKGVDPAPSKDPWLASVLSMTSCYSMQSVLGSIAWASSSTLHQSTPKSCQSEKTLHFRHTDADSAARVTDRHGRHHLDIGRIMYTPHAKRWGWL